MGDAGLDTHYTLTGAVMIWGPNGLKRLFVRRTAAPHGWVEIVGAPSHRAVAISTDDVFGIGEAPEQLYLAPHILVYTKTSCLDAVDEEEGTTVGTGPFADALAALCCGVEDETGDLGDVPEGTDLAQALLSGLAATPLSNLDSIGLGKREITVYFVRNEHMCRNLDLVDVYDDNLERMLVRCLVDRLID